MFWRAECNSHEPPWDILEGGQISIVERQRTDKMDTGETEDRRDGGVGVVGREERWRRRVERRQRMDEAHTLNQTQRSSAPPRWN